MNIVFSERDRQNTFDDILSIVRECPKIVSLVQVGSGAIGYYDRKSDLDFVIALDADDVMPEVMAYMHQRISEKYELAYFKQVESAHLQVYVLSNLLEIDLGYGGYQHASARKPAFKVLYDNTGVVENKMIQSREWMDRQIYEDKQKKDTDSACGSAWAHLMHAAVAIKRENVFRAIGELEFVRKQYIDLLGDRYRLEAALNREIDRLPENEKEAIRSTFVIGSSPEKLWSALFNLTDLIYKELDGCMLPVSREMLYQYYQDCKCVDRK